MDENKIFPESSRNRLIDLPSLESMLKADVLELQEVVSHTTKITKNNFDIINKCLERNTMLVGLVSFSMLLVVLLFSASLWTVADALSALPELNDVIKMSKLLKTMSMISVASSLIPLVCLVTYIYHRDLKEDENG